MKNQKNKQKQNKKTPKETHTKIIIIKDERERARKKTHPIFPNDFSNIVYLFLHQNLLSTIHLRY